MTKINFNKLFDSKVFWIVVSILASLLIWVYITGTQEEYIESPFRDVEVVLSGAENLKQSKGYVVTDVDVQTISVTLYGTRANIGRLGSEDIKAVIDLSKVTKTGQNRWVCDISYPNTVDSTAVRVISQAPEYISFTVSQMTAKTVPVMGAFVGSVAEGYVAEEPIFDPTTITLSGPDSELAKIDHVWATIGGDELTKSKTADVSYTLVDANDKTLEYTDISGDYDTVRVTLPISVKKGIPLTVNLIEGAGATLDNCVVTIEPASIVIAGDSAIVDGINKLVLATIDLTDFSASSEETYTIQIPNDVQNITGITEAKVKIEIVGLTTKKLLVSNLSFINLPKGYSAEILTRNIEVTVRASADVLKKIKADNLRAVADLTDIATMGDVTVPVKIYVDGFTNAGAVGDCTMTLHIK
ncbi:MAG: CdaR family protein [Oscillospiraceae bacterium]